MRELFIVGLKLYGAVSFFNGVTTLISLAALLGTGPGAAGIASTWLVAAGVSFAIVLVTVLQAERLADLFGLSKEESTHLNGFSSKAALRTGLILLGVYYALRYLPALFKEFSSLADPNAPSSPQSNLFAVLQVALPVALIFANGKIAKFIEDSAR